MDTVGVLCSGKDVSFQTNGKYTITCIGIYVHDNFIQSRYTREWEASMTRLGRWVDFENDYKTMDPTFMESVWWVFSQLYEKDLVYRGHKVMPFSTGCSTPLSNFEAGLNYKDVSDPSITVAFKSDTIENCFFLAWTSTPWTLPRYSIPWSL